MWDPSAVQKFAWVIGLCLLCACDATHFREVNLPRASDSTGQARVAAPAPPPAPRLRFSVAGIESPRETYNHYARLFQKLGERLGMEVEFVQRDSYREVNELVATGRVDAALVCTGGYLDLEGRHPGAAEILAVPVRAGTPMFRALIVVPTHGARSLEQLRGKRFAYSDKVSFSGHAYVDHLLREKGHDPAHFFRSVLYTRHHDRSIRAVAAGLVDGAAVHGGVLAQLFADHPELSSRVRVLHESQPFGAMAVVSGASTSAEFRQRLRSALTSLDEDPEVQATLRGLGLEGFITPPAGLYDSARAVMPVSR